MVRCLQWQFLRQNGHQTFTVQSNVLFPTSTPNERLVAALAEIVALIVTLVITRLVLVAIALLGKRLLTDLALVRLFLRMDSFVNLELRPTLITIV